MDDALWYPYTPMPPQPAPVRIVRGRGAWLEAEDGRRYLDAISSWWVTLHGHGEPSIAAAIGAQARELEQVILSGFNHQPARELASRLLTVLPPGMERVFLSDDGSTAVEVALKMALQYWRHRGQPQRRRLVALEHAYHGDTLGAMAVSARSVFTAAFDWLLPDVERVHSAYCHRCPVGRKRADCDVQCLDRLRALLESQGQEIAALILEPLLQGAGGMIVHPVEFVQRTAELCREHGVLLIADEVLTGFGRTGIEGGSLFASGNAGIGPDIICLSKGLTGGFLPLGATACRGEIFAAFCGDRERTLFHGHSFTGNPIACAAALASLELLQSEATQTRIRQLCGWQRAGLERLRGHARVADARQAGTVAAIELADAEHGYLAAIGPRLQAFFLERGVLLRPLGTVIYALPPFCAGEGEIQQIWETIEAGLNAVVGAA